MEESFTNFVIGCQNVFISFQFLKKLNKLEERKGYRWVQASNGGFWVKDSSGSKHNHKLEFFCPHCRRITGTVDDKYLQEYGFCSFCFVMHVEHRQVPTIDIEYYKKLKTVT